MTVDLLKKPATGGPQPPENKKRREAPPQYAVALFRPKEFDERFCVRVAARTFCQAKAYKAAPDNAEMRASYAQHYALEMIRNMCRKNYVIAAIYPSRDIAETKIAEVKAQEAMFGGPLPTRCVRIL